MRLQPKLLMKDNNFSVVLIYGETQGHLLILVFENIFGKVYISFLIITCTTQKILDTIINLEEI